MEKWEQYLASRQKAYIDQLADFLRIPSVSSLKEHDADVARAAEWVAERLKQAGMETVEILPTAGHPVVYAEWVQAPDKPTVLVYGHYDVQPVDPVDLWTSPPFEPAVRNNRIYARGASDDKGNMLVPIVTAEALLQTSGELPLNVKFLFEGEEEKGSPSLGAFLKQHKARLQCDLVLNADSGQWDENQPVLLLGLRGLVGVQIDVTGPKGDLHSGLYGGVVPNPAHALVHLLDSMHADDGSVAVEGFYEQVRSLTQPDRELLAALPFDEADLKAQVGVDALYGEPGFSALERIGARPTLEINGLWSGFQGEGIKTVLPSMAHAKVTCRLVPDQEPDAIRERLQAHVARHTPPGVRVEVKALDGGARPYLIPADHPGNQAAAKVLKEIYQKEPFYVREGGTVPVTALLLEHLGVYSTGFGFALRDENFHAPNEFYRLDSFAKGQVAYGKMLACLAQRL